MERRYSMYSVGTPRALGSKKYRMCCRQCGYRSTSTTRTMRCPECGTLITGH